MAYHGLVGGGKAQRELAKAIDALSEEKYPSEIEERLEKLRKEVAQAA